MPLQHGCRMIGVDRTLDGISHRNRLAGIRHAQDDALALQDLADAHGDGVVRTAARVGNHPSPSCCRRQASSSVTTM